MVKLSNVMVAVVVGQVSYWARICQEGKLKTSIAHYVALRFTNLCLYQLWRRVR